MNIAVVTAIYGGYDELKIVPKQTVEAQFVCFTDGNMPAEVGAKSESEVWSVIVDPKPEYNHNRMKAKFFKINPHVVWDVANPKPDIVIWIDGSGRITSPTFVEDIVKMLGDSKYMAFKHPENRDCIYQEAEYCRTMPKYQGLPIREQVQHYRNEGMPEHFGLWACGLLVYRPFDEEVIKFNQLWFNHNRTFTYQDQLSFPFLIWKLKMKINTLMLDQYKNYLIDFKNQHASLN